MKKEMVSNHGNFQALRDLSPPKSASVDTWSKTYGSSKRKKNQGKQKQKKSSKARRTKGDKSEQTSEDVDEYTASPSSLGNLKDFPIL